MIASRVALGVALAMFALLAGCGQKGPLYMPGDEQAAEQYDPAGAHEPAEAQEENRPAQSQSDTAQSDMESAAGNADDGDAVTTNGNEDNATTREAGE